MQQVNEASEWMLSGQCRTRALWPWGRRCQRRGGRFHLPDFEGGSPMVATRCVRCTSGCFAGFGRVLATLVLVVGLISGAPMLVEAQAPRSPTPAPVPGVVPP
jgi:hypothetical protein